MADNYIDVTLSEIFGTGVASVEQTQTSEEPGGLNVWTITLTNGYTSTFTVRNGTAGGTPMPVVNSADMTDTNGIYLYLGNEEGYTTGHWYCYANGMWTDFGSYSEKGEPGFAPTVETSKTGGTTTVTITDAVGEHVITIEDGISPTVNVANTASDMTDTSLLYVYAGSETGYTNGNWYFYNTTTNQWTSGGQYQSTVPRIDTSLTVAGAAADSAKVGQEISDLKIQISTNTGVPSEVKQAIATLLNSALYKFDGLTDEKAVIASWASQITAITINQSSISISGTGTYQLTATTTPSGGAVTWASSDTSVATVNSNGLVTSVSNGTATITASCGGLSASCTATITGFATLSSISAVFTQEGDIYPWTTLDSLKDDLVVTATYSDSSTQVLSDDAYSLSGTLALGTSTITATYLDKSATFTVTVTEKWSYNIDDLTKLTGTFANNTGANCGISLNRTGSTNTYRRSFAVGNGVTSFALGANSTSAVDAQTSDYYPIKVPAGTTSFTVSITPSTQYIQVLTRQLTDGVYSTYSAPGGSGYVQGSTTRTPEACPDNVYIFVTSKYNSAGTSYATEPTGLDITFEAESEGE